VHDVYTAVVAGYALTRTHSALRVPAEESFDRYTYIELEIATWCTAT
jgi:hypothetical protein